MANSRESDGGREFLGINVEWGGVWWGCGVGLQLGVSREVARASWRLASWPAWVVQGDHWGALSGAAFGLGHGDINPSEPSFPQW